MESISEWNALRTPAANILTTNSTIPLFFRLLLTQILNLYLFTREGGYGKQSDGGVFRYSALYQSLETQSLKLPGDTFLPNSEITLPYVFVGDEAYPLTTYIMKPYGRRTLDRSKVIFNCRLSRARRVVECAFGWLNKDRPTWCHLLYYCTIYCSSCFEC